MISIIYRSGTSKNNRYVREYNTLVAWTQQSPAICSCFLGFAAINEHSVIDIINDIIMLIHGLCRSNSTVDRDAPRFH